MDREKRDSSPSTVENRGNRQAEDGLSEQAQRAIEAIQFITEHLTQDNKVCSSPSRAHITLQYKTSREEWKFVSMVIDRLLLYIFFAVTATGTLGILCSAPNVFEYVDQATVLSKLRAAAAASQTKE